jgi:putative nucleotidyltransferase with HDIG domain
MAVGHPPWIANEDLVSPLFRRARRDNRRPQAFRPIRSRPRALADLLDALDGQTRQHSLRVAWAAAWLGEALGWSPRDVARLREAALLHDVGKLGIPPDILYKPEQLSRGEAAWMRRHPELGADLVDGLLDPEQVSWILHHHERVDGAGYPDGIPGRMIPEGALVIAVADCLDAMTSARPYAEALTWEEAVDECRRVAGHQLDARVVAALSPVLAQVRTAVA